MHLSPEDLLDLIHGDTHPEDLDEQLNHMDRCQECADAHAVLVSLQAHRDAALEALREAEADSTPNTIPFPTPAPDANRGWARQYLRLAATVAVAALLAVVIWTSPIMQRGELEPAVDLTSALASLTTDEFVEIIGRPSSDAVRRAGEEQLLEEARQALLAGQPEHVLELLSDAPTQSDVDYLRFYTGVAHYLTGQPEAAVVVLESLGDGSDSAILRQACWYRANALLRLGRTDESLQLLDELAAPRLGSESWLLVFGSEADALASEVRDLLASTDAPR